MQLNNLRFYNFQSFFKWNGWKSFKRRGKTLVGKFKTKNIKYLPSGDIALRELWTQVLKSDWVQRKGENSTWNLPSKPQRNEENLDCAVFCFLSICVGSKLWDQLWRKQMYAKIIKVSTDGDITCVLRVTWKRHLWFHFCVNNARFKIDHKTFCGLTGESLCWQSNI